MPVPVKIEGVDDSLIPTIPSLPVPPSMESLRGAVHLIVVVAAFIDHRRFPYMMSSPFAGHRPRVVARRLVS